MLGYVNPLTTTLEFDAEITSSSDPRENLRFQNNIQSIFSRVRLLYGSTPLEDIINYNVIVRCLTEWTGPNTSQELDQSSITDGIAGSVYSQTQLTTGRVHGRMGYVHGNSATGSTTAPNSQKRRRYQVQLALGMFTQEKLIPTKWMASQLAIELTLANVEDCMLLRTPTGAIQTLVSAGPPAVYGENGTPPSYTVKNVNLIPEVMEFDSSYDMMFLKGLREGGVPIKFASWHTYLFSTNGSSTVNLMIQERSRSVKALFCVQRRQPASLFYDSGACFYSTTSTQNSEVTSGSTLQNFQFRIGGKYYPAAPVQCSLDTGSSISNMGAEAYTELSKALNIMGDYRLSTSTNSLRWGLSPFKNFADVTTPKKTLIAAGKFLNSNLSEYDWGVSVTGFGDNGNPEIIQNEEPDELASSTAAGNAGSACFAMATSLETTNGVEISGLNAEEQSDISLLATYSNAQAPNFSLEVYTYFDSMIVLRENNVLELIQ